MKRQVFTFLIVGGIGFAVDAGITQALISLLHVPQLTARLPAIACAVLVTFFLNKHHTFGAKDLCLAKSFGKYAASTALSQSVNFAAYSLLVLSLEFSQHLTFLAVGFGSICAAAVTFFLSKYWVFKA